MNTNEIKAVVDMVSDKISGGIQAVQPLADEVVKQYASREFLYSIELAAFSLLFAIISAVGVGVLFKGLSMPEDRYDDNSKTAAIMVGSAVLVIFGLITCVCVDTAFSHYGKYLSPLCGLIGK